MLEILYKSKSAVAVVKPAGVPSQSDASGDKDITALLAERLSALGESGELYTVHRLDRAVGGIMLLARNKKTAAEISECFASHKARKKYLAVVEGEARESDELVDYIYRDSVLSKAFVTNKRHPRAKEARLSYKCLATKEYGANILSLVEVTLETGRFHQIRAQLSSRSLPIVGDGKYGSKTRGVPLALFSSSLAVSDGKREIVLRALPSTDGTPWSLFGEILEKYSITDGGDKK